MVSRGIITTALALAAVTGCIHKPEGPAERIGRSIDEISAAIDDIGQDESGQKDRLRRERERRDREAAARRDRFDRDDDRLGDPYRDRTKPLPPLPEDEFRTNDNDELEPLDDPYGGPDISDRERY